jgi:hypothetical protein
LVVAAAAGKIAPGASGNLIIEMFQRNTNSAANPKRPNAPARPAAAPALPAIPFTVVAE